ncbi:MAG: ABC transporter substrate-binding protein [Treponema sp.]|jgi:peptide/nickel transport system substrate-binding protein|nr:ABC transporter substrate-binding protein [Treponema sp.]
MKRFFVLLILGIAAVTGVFAAGNSAAKSGGKTFTVAINGDITSMDPAYVYDYSSNVVGFQIFETLLTYDANNNLIPYLAESWRAVDNLTYVYKIRGDVKFSDGTPLTADDVVFSIENARKEESYVAWMFAAVESVTQTGNLEVTVKLNSPSASWPHVLATAGGVISKAYYQKHQSDFGTAKGGILATGAYIFDHWTSGQEIALKRNSNYWNKQISPYFDTIVYKIIPDDNTRVTALRTGEVDYMENPPLDLLPVINADQNLATVNYKSFSVVFFAFNTQRAPFTDVNIRKAIYHALDLESLHRNIIKEGGTIATVLPQGEGLYGTRPQDWRNYLAGAPKYDYNLDTARSLLAASSMPNGFKFSLITNEDSLRNSMALFIQDSLAKLNIQVEIVKVSDDEHTEYQFGGVLKDGKRDYDSILAGWTADYPDVGNNIEPLFAADQAGEGGTNSAAYANPQVDTLIKQENALTDENARNQAIFQALDVITAEVPYIFITYPNRRIVHNRKWSGVNIYSAAMAQTFKFYNIQPR